MGIFTDSTGTDHFQNKKIKHTSDICFASEFRFQYQILQGRIYILALKPTQSYDCYRVAPISLKSLIYYLSSYSYIQDCFLNLMPEISDTKHLRQEYESISIRYWVFYPGKLARVRNLYKSTQKKFDKNKVPSTLSISIPSKRSN